MILEEIFRKSVDKFGKFNKSSYLCIAFKEFWRGGRVVDCGGLENRCAARHPGFESLSLR